MTVAFNVQAVRERLAAASIAAGRPADDVVLVAVSKRQPIDRVFAAHDAGVRDFGDNTVQGLCATAEAFATSGREATWHFVGHLQKNKVNKLLPHVSLIHTVDSDDLADALDTRGPEVGVDVLVQVNVGDESQKSGVPVADAVAFARAVAARPRLNLRGLMAMPPHGEDARPYFETMAELARELRATPEGSDATELSMGMTGDFEAAIACGSTMVRVGTAVFGERTT